MTNKATYRLRWDALVDEGEWHIGDEHPDRGGLTDHLLVVSMLDLPGGGLDIEVRAWREDVTREMLAAISNYCVHRMMHEAWPDGAA